jgi:hypothetical protein
MMAQMVQLQIAHQIQNLKEKVEAAWKQHRYNQGIIRLARLAVGGTTPQMRANLEKQNKEIRDSVDEMNKEIAALEQQLRDIKKKNAGEVDRLTQMIKDLELKLQEAGGDVGDLQGALGPILPDPIEEAIVAAEEDFVDAGMQELLDVYSEPGIEDYVIADHAVNWTPEPGESTPPALWNPSVTESFVDVAIDLSVIPPYTQETAPYSPSNTPAYAPPAYPQMNPPAVPSAAPPSYPQMNVPAVPAAAPINYPQMPTPANPVPYSAYPEYPGFPMMPTP